MNQPKTAGILIIGDEILSGRTQDTNTQTLARMLGEKGISVREVRVIPDIVDVIADTVNAMRGGVDYLFTTGGIGPTHDDKTAESVAKAFGVTLERNAEAWARLVRHYGGEEAINPGRARMANIPAGARLIDNPVSTAPGFILGNVHVMAGVPKIMQGMMEGLLPTLEGGAIVHSRSVSAELPESELAEGLEAIENDHSGVSVGSYPKFTPGMKPATQIVIRGVDLRGVESARQAVFNLMKDKGGTPVLG
jgi:molybdenum cofactor synthesis domain-containing protein